MESTYPFQDSKKSKISNRKMHPATTHYHPFATLPMLRVDPLSELLTTF
jgi:hypothetical protein